MVRRKRTYTDVTDPRILEIWEEVKAEAMELYPQYFEDCEPELYHNGSVRYLGYCTQQFANPKERNIDKIRHSKCIILISTNLGQDYEQIRSTLCHELGHFVAPKEKHSTLWKARANKIGKRWGCEASRLTYNETFVAATAQARSNYKYRVYCPNCGTEWKYKKNCQTVQNPGRYICSKCKSTLKSEQI